MLFVQEGVDFEGVEINSRGNLQREMEIKRDSYLEQLIS